MPVCYWGIFSGGAFFIKETIMEKVKKYMMSCIFIISIVCIGASVSPGSTGETGESTFDFKDCSVSDALHEIGEKAGIRIYSNDIVFKNKINRSYHGLSIEDMIHDLFFKENFAIVYQYRNGRLNTVEILIFDGKGNGADLKSVNSLSQKNNTKRSISFTAPSRSGKTENGSGARKIRAQKLIQDLPPAVPEKWGGLESPPMPPGLHGIN